MKKLLIFFIFPILLLATVPTYENVTQLYVATFNRAPDSAGIKYWVDDSHLSLEDIAKSFFDQSETQTLYPPSTSNRDFIVSVYHNLFNRDPDTKGLDYWKQQLDSGLVQRSVFILAVINGAKDTAEYGNDKTILNNKGLAGLYFALNNYNDTTLAKNILQSVTDSPSSVDTIKDKLYEDSGTSSTTSCIVDFLYFNGNRYTTCYVDMPIDTCKSIKNSDDESTWYGFPVKGDCLSLGYPEDSKDTTTGAGAYVYYGKWGLYGDDNGYININDSTIISQTGGEKSISDMIIDVPQDAIYGSENVRAGKLGTTDSDSLSSEYAMTDILDKLQKPITVKLPLAKNVNAGTDVAFEYIPAKGGYSTSGGDSPYIWMFDAKLSNNYAVGQIYNFTDTQIPSGLSLWGRIKDALNPINSIKDTYSFIQAKAMHRTMTNDGAFKIYYSVNFASFNDPTLTLVDLVRDGLTTAETKLKNMGFDFDSLHKPIPVVLVKSSLMSSSTYKAEQTKPTKFVTNKYPMIKVNTAELLKAKNNTKTADAMRSTLGHEFFHTVQSLYDPSWFNNSSSLFLSEMSSVWFEYIMSNNPATYSTDVARAYATFQNYGIDYKSFGKYTVWTKGHINSIQNLAYGASTFLLYLTVYTQNNSIVYDIWQNYKNGNTAIQSIDRALQDDASTDLSTMWRRFAKDFNTGFKNFPYKDRASWPQFDYSEILNAKFDMPFTKSFTMPPYSANSIYIGNANTKQGYDINITISQKGGSKYDGDAYIFDALDMTQLQKLNFDGKPVTFHIDKKPSKRSIVLINSGPTKMDVKLNIISDMKKFVAFTMQYSCHDSDNKEVCSVENDPDSDIIKITDSGIVSAFPDFENASGTISDNGAVDITESYNGSFFDEVIHLKGTVSSGTITGTSEGIYPCSGTYTGRYLDEDEALILIDKYKDE